MAAITPKFNVGDIVKIKSSTTIEDLHKFGIKDFYSGGGRFEIDIYHNIYLIITEVSVVSASDADIYDRNSAFVQYFCMHLPTLRSMNIDKSYESNMQSSWWYTEEMLCPANDVTYKNYTALTYKGTYQEIAEGKITGVTSAEINLLRTLSYYGSECRYLIYKNGIFSGSGKFLSHGNLEKYINSDKLGTNLVYEFPLLEFKTDRLLGYKVLKFLRNKNITINLDCW